MWTVGREPWTVGRVALGVWRARVLANVGRAYVVRAEPRRTEPLTPTLSPLRGAREMHRTSRGRGRSRHRAGAWDVGRAYVRTCESGEPEEPNQPPEETEARAMSRWALGRRGWGRGDKGNETNYRGDVRRGDGRLRRCVSSSTG
jgi:hypothetical protein